MSSIDVQTQLKALGYNSEIRSQERDDLLEVVLGDLLSAKGAVAEAEARAERQVEDLQAALQQVASLSADLSAKERTLAHLQQQNVKSQSHEGSETSITILNLSSKLKDAENRNRALQAAAELEAARCAKLEMERDGLRLKVQSLLEVSQQCNALNIPIRSIAATVESAGPLTPSPGRSGELHDASGLSKGGISLVKAAANRVDTLEMELYEARQKLEKQQRMVDSLKDACAVKDEKVVGLEAQLAASKANTSDLEAFEKLTQHANRLAAELETLRQKAPDARAHAATEARAAAAEKQQKALLAELERVKTNLEELSRESEAATAAAAKVTKLRVALDEVKAQEAAGRASAEIAEGKAAELEDRLERRDKALSQAQSRCRALEAELHRLRQLKSLKGQNKDESSAEKKEIEQLTMQCASMAAHLQRSMELQEAAVAAAASATAERDEALAEAENLRAELEDAHMHLEDAASAAAAVRRRLFVSESPSAVSKMAESDGDCGDEGSVDQCKSSIEDMCDKSWGHLNGQTTAQQLVFKLEAAKFDITELRVEAAQEREAAHALRERCASLEAEINTLRDMVKAPSQSSEDADCAKNNMPSPTIAEDWTSNSAQVVEDLQAKIAQKQQECDVLAAAGSQADVALQKCLEQLRAMTAKLQKAKEKATAIEATLHEKDTLLRQAQYSVNTLEQEKAELQQQLAHAEAAVQQQTERLAEAFTAEREAAARDFDTLRNEMHSISKQYQELSMQLVAVQRERDTAAEAANSAATQIAFYEQAAHSKEAEVQPLVASYSALQVENRQLQDSVAQLQRELMTQSCQVRFGQERAQAALQRKVAAAEGGHALLEARLADAGAEISVLREKLLANSGRVEELEALLAEERMRQFQAAEESKEENRMQGDAEMHDAIDERLLQRLEELEAECLQLRAELQRERQKAAAAGEEACKAMKMESLAELAQHTGSTVQQMRFNEIYRSREDAEAAEAGGAVQQLPGGGNGHHTRHQVLQQLQNIAQGLHEIGNG